MFSLLLDFDGTLFDTESGHEAAYQQTFEHFNLGPFPSYETLKGIKTKEVFARYRSIYADTDSLAKKMREIYDSDEEFVNKQVQARTFVALQAGATERIMSYLNEHHHGIN